MHGTVQLQGLHTMKSSLYLMITYESRRRNLALALTNNFFFLYPFTYLLKIIHVGDCLTCSSSPLLGESSLPVSSIAAWSSASITLPASTSFEVAQVLAGLEKPFSSF